MPKTPINIKKEIYSDFHKDMRESPITKDLARLTNEDAVKDSIRNLILTDRGERPFQPRLGCDIRKMLFENITPQTIITSKLLIEETIRRYEPRCNLIGVDVIATSARPNTINIIVIFNVINVQEPVVLNVVLERTR